MAKYLILIYGDAKEWDNSGPEERERIMAGHRAFSAAAGDRILDGNELMPPTTATSLRPTVTDGPFLETKEVLGGYYVVEATDLDAVIELAELLPEVGTGFSGVEIRPVVDHG